MQVPKFDTKGVRMIKSPLLACRIICKCSMETSHSWIKKSNLVIRSSSVTGSQIGVMEGVSAYGHHLKCHVTFGRGGFVSFHKIRGQLRPSMDHLRRRFQTFNLLDTSLPFDYLHIFYSSCTSISHQTE